MNGKTFMHFFKSDEYELEVKISISEFLYFCLVAVITEVALINLPMIHV